MTAPLVTIVIPTFNRSAMLRRCIESVLVQTQACEVIVVDHGSSDDTPAVATSFGDRIRYLRRDVDHGVHFCWLDGVINAKGEFVHLNFDDDYLEPTYVEKCMALMGPEVGLVFSKVALRDEESGRIDSELFAEFGETGVRAASAFMHKHVRGLVSPGAAILRRKDILNALYVGKVPFARHEYRGVGPDWLMTAMATLSYPKVGFVAEPLAVFSHHAGSITVAAGADKEKKRALRRAYQESRRFYALLWLAQTFRLDLLADVSLGCMKLKANLASALSRLFHPRNRKSK
jgi:glycosyltransferase involved in cell wall biosynthesis